MKSKHKKLISQENKILYSHGSGQSNQELPMNSLTELLQKQSLPQLTLKVTFDCGVQADFDISPNLAEIMIQRLQQAKEKKKEKRRQYKKRKKMQKKLLQKSNNQQFKNIINSFYQQYQNNKFQDHSQRLQQLVCSFSQQHFKHIFDQVLKQRVKIIQNSIWQYIQNVLHENPLQMPNDHQFFYQTVDIFYQYYKIIQKSSQQAEQVIYIYLTLNAKNPNQPISPQNLGKKIFRYLIQTDHSLKKLLKMCDRKISLVRYQQHIKLQILFNQLKSNKSQKNQQIMNDSQSQQNQQQYSISSISQNYYQSDQNSQQYQQQQKQQYYQDCKSTAISQNSQQNQQKHQNINLNTNSNCQIKKNIKKKINLQNLSPEDRLFYQLQNLSINHDTRLQCNLDQDQLKQKTQKYIKSFKKNIKQTIFTQLNHQFQLYPYCRQISKQFKRIF